MSEVPEVDPPEDINPNDFPEGELRNAAKNIIEAKEELRNELSGDQRAKQINKYKTAAQTMCKVISRYIQNNDFKSLDPEAKAKIGSDMVDFSKIFNGLTQEEHSYSSFSGKDFINTETTIGKFYENIKGSYSGDYSIGKGGKFSNFLKRVGLKSKDFNDRAKQYLTPSEYNKLASYMEEFKSQWTKTSSRINDSTGKLNKDTINGSTYNDEIDRLDDLDSNIDSIIKKVEEKYQTDEQTNNPGKALKGNQKLGYFIKFFALLEILGAGIFAWWLIKQYCDNHTGCLQIQYRVGQSYIQNNKKYCELNTIPKGYSKTSTYCPELCFCSQFTSLSEGPNTKDNCTIVTNSDKNKFTPDNKKYLGTPCTPANGDMTNIPNDGSKPFLYYSYVVMTPFDGLIDIADKGSSIAKNFFKDLINIIIHAVIIIGIVIGILLVLYIVYKLVSNRKSPETLKIETDSSKFGNILGNLNKFSRYNHRFNF